MAKRGRPSKSITVSTNIDGEKTETVSNSLADAVGFTGNLFGFPQNQGSPYTAQLSNVTTIFRNMRWYLVSNFRQPLSEAYVELGLVQAIVDLPVDDGLRGGVEITSKELSEGEIKKLVDSLDRDDDLNVVGQAAKWNRLFGGAGVLILTDQDPDTPLDMNAIHENTPLEFRAVDMWELFWDKQNTEGYDPTIQADNFDFYNYYGVQVHKSRVMRLVGATAPSFIRPRLRGWGFSVVEILVRSINQYLKATDLMFEVLDEFKLDIFKIKNLVNTLMSPDGAQQVYRRVQLANFQKNYQNALTMDSEDDFDHKQLSFSGLAETMQQIRMQVASDMRMPLTKLFGISAAGFNSGEDDIEVYNSMVESQVRNKIKYHILRMCEIKCQKLFGFVPDDLALEFKPLREMSAPEQEQVKDSKFNRLMAAAQAGQLTAKEFREACNRDNLLGITLDVTDEMNDAIGGFMSDDVAEGANDPTDPKDTNNPGADRMDTKQPTATEVGGVAKESPNKSKPAPKSQDQPDAIAKEPKDAEDPKVPKTRNEQPTILKMPTPFTTVERAQRLINSNAFDKKSYEADGGDKWIDARRALFFDKDKAKDKDLWDRSVQASRDIFGAENWKFIVWKYSKLGGKF